MGLRALLTDDGLPLAGVDAEFCGSVGDGAAQFCAAGRGVLRLLPARPRCRRGARHVVEALVRGGFDLELALHVVVVFVLVLVLGLLVGGRRAVGRSEQGLDGGDESFAVVFVNDSKRLVIVVAAAHRLPEDAERRLAIDADRRLVRAALEELDERLRRRRHLAPPLAGRKAGGDHEGRVAVGVRAVDGTGPAEGEEELKVV
mmetsp:Transcript_25005/g.86350  ORF Transcript_25005/g.86350 Transcript_25005/m.86350 type:complete len:202 (+) Transcript_25005:792-1397(+)